MAIITANQDPIGLLLRQGVYFEHIMLLLHGYSNLVQFGYVNGNYHLHTPDGDSVHACVVEAMRAYLDALVKHAETA